MLAQGRQKGCLAESTGDSTTIASASSIHLLWLDWDVKQHHSWMTWVNWGFSSLRSIRLRLETPNHLHISESIRLMCSQRTAALTQPMPFPRAPGTLSMKEHPAAELISTPESYGSWNFSSTYQNIQTEEKWKEYIRVLAFIFLLKSRHKYSSSSSSNSQDGNCSHFK